MTRTRPVTPPAFGSSGPMTRAGLRRLVARLALTSVGAIAVVEWAVAVLRPEGGPLGLAQVIAPHLAVVGLILIPVALLDRRTTTVVAVTALAAVAVFRFGGDWLSLPAAPPAADASRIEAVTWNLEVGSRSGAAAVALLATQSADVIALQELQPDTAASIDADPALRARFPYRVLVPRADVLGLGLLSRYPISKPTFRLGPAVQEAALDLGDGRRLAVINAHPLHAEIVSFGGRNLPVGLDVRRRNADLAAIRARFDARTHVGLPVLLLGDLNTAASEPAIDRLVDGLRDVHAEVGHGPGWTWRPIRLEFLGFGLVRIDYVVVSPTIEPLSIEETCPPVGDHCLVHAQLAIPGAG